METLIIYYAKYSIITFAKFDYKQRNITNIFYGYSTLLTAPIVIYEGTLRSQMRPYYLPNTNSAIQYKSLRVVSNTQFSYFM